MDLGEFPIAPEEIFHHLSCAWPFRAALTISAAVQPVAVRGYHGIGRR
jgi:hypothetical protein